MKHTQAEIGKGVVGSLRPELAWTPPGKQVRGRPAQQAEDCEAIPKKSDRWLIEFTRIRQLSAFSLPRTALCGFNAKLAETVCQCI
jgi:hypothetical protein